MAADRYEQLTAGCRFCHGNAPIEVSNCSRTQRSTQLDEGRFQYRRLIVYQRACQYDDLAQALIPVVQESDRNLADHLKRSTNSFLTNVSEGASDDRPLMKAASYRTAKREAEECALSLEISLRRKYTRREPTEKALEYLDECTRMLAALINRFDPPAGPS